MPPAASLDDVWLKISPQDVLSGVSLTVPAGTITALVGPNGCGKSTIARMLAGFLFPSRGAVNILGHRLGTVSVHHLRERVKLVQPAMPLEPADEMKVRDVVLTGAFGTIDLHDEPTRAHHARADDLIARLGLDRVEGSSFRTCSSGERMRAHIARALMSRPALLILDEPTSGLDLPMREGLLLTLAVIARSDDAPAILLVTHHLDEIPPAATHAVLMSTGRVHAAGAPRDVLRSDLMSEAFRFPIAVTRTEDDRFYAHSRATAIE